MKPKSCKLGNFTLIEILAAMAVFLVLSVVMMRLFNSAQRIYNTVTQRNIIYADARVALDIITRDLHCALFNNDNSAAGIYPFWFEFRAPAVPVGNDYYPEGIEVTRLNFIASTGLKSPHAASNISEIRYTFARAGGGGIAKNNGTAETWPEGSLVRSCTGDKFKDIDNIVKANAKYNFADLPFGDSPANRVVQIFQDTSSDAYVQVITGVYNLKFTCYTLVAGNMRTLRPLSSGSVFGTGDVGDGNLVEGTPLPVAVKVELQIFAPSDWREWKRYADSGDAYHAEKIKRERLRTFSKTIFLGVRESF